MWLIPSQFHPCKDKQSRCQQDPWEASLFQLKDSDTCMVPRTDQGRPTPAKAQLSSQTPILPECKHTCSVSPFVRPGGKPVSLILQSSHVGPFLIFQTLLYSSTNTIQAGPEIQVYCPLPLNRTVMALLTKDVDSWIWKPGHLLKGPGSGRTLVPLQRSKDALVFACPS